MICCRPRCKPTTGGHYRLECFTIQQIVAKLYYFKRTVLLQHINMQCLSFVKLPAFIRLYAMKSAKITGRQ